MALTVPGQDAGNVLCGLPLADLDGVWTQVDGVPSQPEEALCTSASSQSSQNKLCTCSKAALFSTPHFRSLAQITHQTIGDDTSNKVPDQ